TYVIAVRKGERDLQVALDAALADMDARGELEAIYARYHLPPRPTAPPAAAAGASESGEPQARFDAAQWVLFLRGAAVTLIVSFLSMALAVPLGLALALARIYGSAPARLSAHAYIEIFRGTP